MNVNKGVQSNCLRQLVTDILSRAYSNPSKIDTPGFASTVQLNQLSAMLRQSESEFLSQSIVAVEKSILEWSAAVSYSIASADSRPR